MIDVALVQCDILTDNVDENLSRYEQMLAEKLVGNVDLLVFPEMFNCGFSHNVFNVAENMNGKSVAFLQKLSKSYGCDTVASLPIFSEGQIKNRLLWISGNSVLDFYDKHYLFIGEERYFSPGSSKVIVNSLNYKFLPLICFDVRFPEWSRNSKSDDGSFAYDCLVYVANFPAPRERELLTLAQARAIENQAFVIVVNRIGSDGFGCNYVGGTAIIDPHGNIEAQTKFGESEILQHSCDFNSINQLRKGFKVSDFWNK